MKKILLLAMLFILHNGAYAQSGKLTVINNTDDTIFVTIYGYAPTSCSGGGCAAYQTNILAIPTLWGHGRTPNTWGPYAPCAISSAAVLGFASAACGTGWCGSLPSDFQWTYATVVSHNTICYGSIFPVTVEDVGVGCIPGSSSSSPVYPGCGTYANWQATWSPSSGSALSNVTIDVEQY
jgi:hypothetical protein